MTEKGRYATATQKRRFVWSELVWPLILELNEVVFTLEQYQKKRDQICAQKGVSIQDTSRGLASLLQKGIIFKEKNIYSIHYRLIPYMRLRATCDYATAIHEVRVNSK